MMLPFLFAWLFSFTLLFGLVRTGKSSAFFYLLSFYSLQLTLLFFSLQRFSFGSVLLWSSYLFFCSFLFRTSLSIFLLFGCIFLILILLFSYGNLFGLKLTELRMKYFKFVLQFLSFRPERIKFNCLNLLWHKKLRLIWFLMLRNTVEGLKITCGYLKLSKLFHHLKGSYHWKMIFQY